MRATAGNEHYSLGPAPKLFFDNLDVMRAWLLELRELLLRARRGAFGAG